MPLLRHNDNRKEVPAVVTFAKPTDHQHVWIESRDGTLNGKPAYVAECDCGYATPRFTKGEYL